jgi:hypothetical protein
MDSRWEWRDESAHVGGKKRNKKRKKDREGKKHKRNLD